MSDCRALHINGLFEAFIKAQSSVPSAVNSYRVRFFLPFR
ncbi:hypothetical protein KPSA1_06067 [Pseudomonas syringae pv. actinidiae]|uniref:Uncharacterized protein n=1 Tax=Pseudomonas syringae pv. actinidiae TaxID=103796 RepID=A0A2V0QIF4_PSESF|nr:hypothetical protein KPSA1_06067 [Pseudomonas syringae pv. actinidiae]